MSLSIDDLLGASAVEAAPPPAHVPAGGAGSGVSAPGAIAGGAYEGADRFDRSMALWSPPILSADNEILPAKAMVQARVGDTIRNDAYVANAANLHRDHIVGSLFLLNSKPATRILWGKEDEVWETEFQEEIEEKFTLWAESTECWADATRRNTFSELVRLAVGVNFMGGECLTSVEWLREEVDRPFNTAFLMLDLERVDTPPEHSHDINVRAGVRRNQRGRPMGYYVRQGHPTDWRDPAAHQWKYVPAAKPWGRKQMIHVYEQVRPDQSRGMAQIACILREAHQAKTMRAVALQNMIINSSFAAAIESDLPSDAVFQMLGGGSVGDPDAVAGAIENYMTGYLDTVAKYVGKSNYAKLNDVKIPHLPPGSKLNLTPVGKGGLLGTDFEAAILRYMAAGSGVPVELFSKDYSKTNYSSIKAGLADLGLYMGAKKKIIADRWATEGFRLWFEEAANRNQIEALKRARVPNFYDPLVAEAYTACEWIGASRGQVEELKETQAAVARINAGISTREIEIARFGRDYRKMFRQIAREKKLAEQLGISFMSDEGMMGAVEAAANGDQEAKEPRRDQ